MATDFGTDISAVTDLDPMMPTLSGRALLIQDLSRRYITPRGSLFYDPNYGYSLIELVGDTIGPGDAIVIQSEIAQEALKDERILLARCILKYTATTETLRVGLQLRDATGPFSLVLDVSKTSVSILTAPQSGLQV